MGQSIVTSLNSSLESAVRLLIILDAEYPTERNLDELIALDHVAAHTEDFQGPPSLHPALPLRSGDMGAAREAIRGGIEVLVHRGMAEIKLSADGIRFVASDGLHPVVAVLQSPYLLALKERAEWVRSTGLLNTPADVRDVIKSIAEAWPVQSQQAGDVYA